MKFLQFFYDEIYPLRKEKRRAKKAKKSKSSKEKRKVEPLAEIYPSLPQVSIPKNPSPFAVFAAIRNTCLENKRKQDTILQLQSAGKFTYLAKLILIYSYFINLTMKICCFILNF